MAPNTLEIPSVYDIIQELQGSSGGNKTFANIVRGITSRPSTPAATARQSAAPMTLDAPSPAANPLLSLGRILPLLQSSVTPPPPPPPVPPGSVTITNPATQAPGGIAEYMQHQYQPPTTFPAPSTLFHSLLAALGL
jgi:hypothetical protein